MRKAQRRAAEHLERDQGAYQPPPRDECNERVWTTIGDDGNTIRVQNRTWHQGGELVDFVICLQVLSADGWINLEYVDCCHGSCHLHEQNGTKRRPIRPLDGVKDVRKAFREAQHAIDERLRIIRE